MPTASSKSIPPAETQARVDLAGRLPRLFPSELFLITAESRAGLRARLGDVAAYLDRPHPAPLHDLAFTLSRAYTPSLECVALVAFSHADLRQKAVQAREKLDDERCARIQNQSGIYYAQDRLGSGKVAFLFPGENAQYVNMLAGLCMNFPEMRRTFDEADAACVETGDGFLPSALNFPPPGTNGSLSAEEEIAQWEKAVVLVHTANTAMSKLLDHLELRPDAVLGHSFGELSALEMAGVLHPGEEAAERVRYSTSAYLHLRQLSREAGLPHGRLLSVGGAERAHLDAILARFPDMLRIAMENCPHQYILAAGGPEMDAVIAEADRFLTNEGAICARLPIERPYHTSFFEPAYPLERAYYEGMGVRPPRIQTYSCSTTEPFPEDPEEILEVAARAWMTPVRFQTTIEKMHARGFRVFVDVGPRGNLCAFVSDILGSKPHLAVALNRPQRPDITQLQHALAILAAHGVGLSTDYLHERWGSSVVALSETDGVKPPPPARMLPLPILLPRIDATGISLPRRPPKPEASSTEPPPPPAVAEQSAPDTAAREGRSDASTDVASVMVSYLSTMERFLETEAQVVVSALAPGVAELLGSGLAEEQERLAAAFPLLGSIVEHVPGESLVSQRVFDVEEDLYLNDHTLGTPPSAADPALRGLPVMPLLMSLEVAAEAGAALLPGYKVIALVDIRAHRWIMFERGQVALRAVAARIEDGPDGLQVRVTIQQEGATGNPLLAPTMVEATVVLATAYPAARASRAGGLPPSIACDWTGSAIYPRRTFHGPLFQGIRGITRYSEEGLDGTLEVLPHTGLLRGRPDVALQYDPILADSLGQAVWLWGSKEPFLGISYLPYAVNAMRFYGPVLPAGTGLDLRLRVRRRDTESVVADLEAVDDAGKVQLAIEGLADRAFEISAPLHRLMLEPLEHFFADVRGFDLETPEHGECRISFGVIAGFPPGILESAFGVWRKALAFLILSPPERQEWQALQVPLRREAQWLLGRAVAKDVVRNEIEERSGRRFAAAEIRIENDASGRPVVVGGWWTDLPQSPQLSISHTDGMVAAVAATLATGLRLGVDTEKIRTPSQDLLDGAFAEGELTLLPPGLGEAERPEWIFRFWCAKEAVGKALGSGVPLDPRELNVTGVEAGSGWIRLRFRASESGELTALTFRRGEHVFAVAVAREAG